MFISIYDVTGNSSAQQTSIPQTIDEETPSAAATGNGDAAGAGAAPPAHAPMLQVLILTSFTIQHGIYNALGTFIENHSNWRLHERWTACAIDCWCWQIRNSILKWKSVGKVCLSFKVSLSFTSFCTLFENNVSQHVLSWFFAFNDNRCACLCQLIIKTLRCVT